MSQVTDEAREEEVFKRNRKWYQVAKQMPIVATGLYDLGKHALPVYMCLIHCSNRTGACSISQKVLKNAIGVKSTRTIHRAINVLAKKGLIAVFKTDTQQNIYVTNPYLVWQKSKAERLGVGHIFNFTANIIVSNNNKDLDSIARKFHIARMESTRNIFPSEYNTKSEQVNGYIYHPYSKDKGKESISKNHKKYITNKNKHLHHINTKEQHLKKELSKLKYAKSKLTQYKKHKNTIEDKIKAEQSQLKLNNIK